MDAQSESMADEAALGVFFLQLLAGDRAGLIGRAEAGGEADEEDIQPLLQLLLHDDLEFLNVHGAGRGLLPGSERLKKSWKPISRPSR